MAEPATRDSAPATLDSRALTLGITTYVLWGFFPLYFRALAPAGSFEVIVHRALWGLVTCLITLAALRRLPRLVAAVRQPAIAGRLAVAGGLIVINWTTYVYAVQSGHTVDAALGYFINPLITVTLAAVVLREKLTPLQITALILGVIAVAVLVIGVGYLPWISLVLALSFGLYSLVKKKVALNVGPLEGMTIETAAVAPFLLMWFAWLAAHGGTSFHTIARGEASVSLPVHAALLVGSGALTMVPLLMFAKAAQKLPLGIMGLIQYISPIMQLILGVAVFHEQMEPIRWVATAIVWLALMCISADWVVMARRQRRLLRDKSA